MRLLIVEDDPVIASELAYAMERERHRVEVAADGAAGLRMALEGSYDVIVLDVMLPVRDGWEVCAALRRAGNETPILMLTARDAIEDRVKGLEGGADDYLVKPFDFREFRARVQTVARRREAQRQAVLQVADLTLDAEARRVTRGNREIRLTQREFALLEALARNAGRTLTRQAILDRVWHEPETLENSVNFHVVSLRRKVDGPGDARLIHTVHGVGYVLRSP
jgi:two-component system copper resistance phosphate regulon response regulator CusR